MENFIGNATQSEQLCWHPREHFSHHRSHFGSRYHIGRCALRSPLLCPIGSNPSRFVLVGTRGSIPIKRAEERWWRQEAPVGIEPRRLKWSHVHFFGEAFFAFFVVFLAAFLVAFGFLAAFLAVFFAAFGIVSWVSSQ